MTDFVSVIVTAYNQAAHLQQAVKSVLLQSYTALECLIIDDGSTDETSAIAEQLARSDARVRYFYKENGGVSSARNYGIQQAKGAWIQFLDADDWLHSDKIRHQLNSVNNHYERELVIYSDYVRIQVDRHSKITGQYSCHIGDLSQRQLIQRLLICPDLLAKSPFPLLQQAMLFKATLFQQVLFDETLKACEDRYLVLQLLLRDVPFVYVPMLSAFYQKHSANMTDDDLLMRSSYIHYFNLAQQQNQGLRPLFQDSVKYSLERSIAEKDTLHFNQLCELAQFPLELNQGRLKISNVIWLKILYQLRLLMPSGLLYEKYRGPRLRKLFSTVSQTLSWMNLPNRA